MYHFLWGIKKKDQGYKSDIPLKKNSVSDIATTVSVEFQLFYTVAVVLNGRQASV